MIFILLKITSLGFFRVHIIVHILKFFFWEILHPYFNNFCAHLFKLFIKITEPPPFCIHLNVRLSDHASLFSWLFV